MRADQKGQVSLEYAAVLASMLIILILIVILFNSLYSRSALEEQYIGATHGVQMLSAYAKDVKNSGTGARATVLVQIPQSVDFSNSSISNRTISLYVKNFGHAFAATDFEIAGRWPTKAGKQMMLLYNNLSHVVIVPGGLISISRSGFYFNSTPSSLLVQIKNEANSSYTFSQALVFSSCPSCTYNLSGASALSAGQFAIGSVAVPAMSSGRYTGYLEINSTSASGTNLENETFVLPITIEVS